MPMPCGLRRIAPRLESNSPNINPPASRWNGVCEPGVATVPCGTVKRRARGRRRVIGEYLGFDMVQLVLIFCLATSPGSCREERPILEQLSLMSCMVQGQQIAQDWLADHPKWTLSRWRCENNIPRQRPT